MKTTEDHYFDLGKTLGRQEFNKRSFIDGLQWGVVITVAFMVFGTAIYEFFAK